MRREERVTVQGSVKEQQPDGMSHRGLGGGTPNHYIHPWGFLLSKNGPAGRRVAGGRRPVVIGHASTARLARFTGLPATAVGPGGPFFPRRPLDPPFCDASLERISGALSPAPSQSGLPLRGGAGGACIWGVGGLP